MPIAVAGRSVVQISGTSTAFSEEACTDLGAQTAYQIDDQTKRLWDSGVALEVEVDDGGGWDVIPVADYTVDPLFGVVTFLVALDPGDEVRVSGSYLPRLTVLKVRGYTIRDFRTMHDSTGIEDSTRKRLAGLSDAEVDVNGLWVSYDDLDGSGDTRKLQDVLTNGTTILISLDPSGDGSSVFRAFATLDQVDNTAVFDGLVEGNIHVAVTGAQSATIGTFTGSRSAFGWGADEAA